MNFIEKIYLFFYLRKKRRDLQNQKRLTFPVVSIGNITLGGTGKTPFTMTLAKESIKRNFTPIILTRGYRGKLKGPLVVLMSYSAKDVGDEPLLMATEGLTVIKSIDRYEGGIFAIKEFRLTKKDKVFFILDDGFQHWRLYRDLNILLIDGSLPLLRSKLFPLGILRSPLNELDEADFVFITKERNEELRLYLDNFSSVDHYYAPLRIKGFYNVVGDAIEPYGKSAFVFAGIGNFDFFLESLRRSRIEILGFKKFIDHKFYSKQNLKEIKKIAKEAELIITTKKDFVKIRDYIDIFEGRLCYPEIYLEIEEDALEKIFSKLEKLFI
ncbi:MAG: tetraacyldisaccharide 4'-kinase [Thermodesulfovibrio sp.]|nr:tetraacyldisaccharide 4'-kinase [Thermodesulfovibrio sp.]